MHLYRQSATVSEENWPGLMTKDDAVRAALDRHPDCTYVEVFRGLSMADPVWIVCLWASARRRAEALVCDYEDIYAASATVNAAKEA